MCAGSSSRFDGVDKFLYKAKALSGNCIMDLVFRRLRRNAGSKNDLPRKYCLDQKLKLMRRPSGTASCIEYLLNQNIANFLSTEGVEYVCVSGM